MEVCVGRDGKDQTVTEQSSKNRSVVSRLGSVALGSASLVGDAVEGGVSVATSVTKGALRAADVATKPVRIPLKVMGVTDRVMAPVDAVSDRIEITVVGLDEKGQEVLGQSSGFAVGSISSIIDAVLIYLENNPGVDRLIHTQIDRVIPVLASHPAVVGLVLQQMEQILPQLASNQQIQDLIKAQAGLYLQYLNEHPEELEELIRAQGDGYIDYLNHYPAAVQTLIQGQSLGMASEVRDELRERTVTGDSIADTIVRSLLRLTPQEEHPLPPEDVRRRAEYGRLPSDFVEEHTYGLK
jgi:hypothetical protein